MAKTNDPFAIHQHETFDVSFGTGALLKRFTDMLSEKKKIPYELFLVNAYTLVRNCYKKDVPIDTLVSLVYRDITYLIQHIAQYTDSVQQAMMTKSSPMIVVYMPTYVIPKEFEKDSSKKENHTAMVLVLEALKKKIKTSGYPNTVGNTSIIFADVGSTNHFPHMELIKDIREHIQWSTHKYTMMISHVVLDFHLHRKFTHFFVLESNTGTIRKPDEFGKKVFGNENLPFNKYTHMLFGDSQFIKGTLTKKFRDECIDEAVLQKWRLISDRQVLAYVLQKGYIAKNLFDYFDV